MNVLMLLQNIRPIKPTTAWQIPSAGPGGNPFAHIFWLAKEEKREHAAGTSTGPPPAPRLTYLPNFQDTLRFHMHTKHKHGYANAKTGSALHMLSGCQNQIIFNMKTERHNDIAGRMIRKALSKTPWGAGLVNTDIANDTRLAQHNLQIPAYASNITVASYLFPCNLSMRDRSTSSQPDAILILSPYNAQPTSNNVSSACSHHALRSRHSTTQRAGTSNRVRQPHQLHANQSHVRLIEIKYCMDARPQHQLDVGKVVTVDSTGLNQWGL
eukprot:527497-Pelagomonas_calceolata.AAC.1